MKIAILGAGSLGTILGAFLSKEGKDVTLIDVNRNHVNALNESGAKVIGHIDICVPVKAITPDEMKEKYDLVFLMIKQTHNKIALNQLIPYLHQKSIVCTLQNGIPENNVAEIVGKERTIGGVVLWGATYIKPGVSELTKTMEEIRECAFQIGELNGKTTERIKKVKAILDLMATTEITTNLMGIRWEKILFNSTMSGMSAVLGCTFGEILDNDKAKTSLVYIAKEAIGVAEGMGIKIPKYKGQDINGLCKVDNKEALERSKQLFVYGWDSTRSSKASMLQDLEKGRKTEIDEINGQISKYGKLIGVETPVNDDVIRIIKGIENGIYKPDLSNLKLMKSLDNMIVC